MTMASTQPSLHIQDLANVMLELEHYHEPRVRMIYDMVRAGQLHPLHEEVLSKLRRSPKQAAKSTEVYAASEWDSPVLSGLEELPFDKLPTAGQVQTILRKEVKGNRSFQFGPTRGSPEADAMAAADLLVNIGNARFSQPGSIIHMASPTFDRLHSRMPDWQCDGNLGQSNSQMTVAPANEVFEPEYYEHHLHSTLLTGTKVWLAFPPLDVNLSALRDEYDDMLMNNTTLVSETTLAKLQHGIAIIQQPGQTLMIPPFWPVMMVSTKTSTSCTYFVATALKFPQRLQNVDLFLAITRLWPKKEQEQAQLITYATTLVNHVRRILRNDIPEFKSEPIAIKLCQGMMYTREQANIRDELAKVCAAIDDKTQARRIEQELRQVWLDFMEEKRKKRLECRLCRMRVNNMAGEGSPSERLAQHFLALHWAPEM